MTNDNLIGLVVLIAGCAFLWWSIKNPTRPDDGEVDMVLGDVKGFLAGVFAIIVGILLITGYIKWQ